jgi:rod shape-determining protein MreC
MAIYSAGRRRTIIILLLTSILLITLDLRGNAIFNTARTGFSYALRPFEIAGEVITTPVARVWSGITEVDDLKAEIRRQQLLIDEQRNAQVAGINAMIENRDLRAQLNLKSLAAYDRVSGEIVGSSASNFDQRVEIDRGSTSGIATGMPVVNEAGGLVGKITQVNPETSVVMLVTDPQYHVPVKVVGEVLPPPSTEPPVTAPSGLPVDDVTTTTSTTSTSTTSTTLPPDDTQPVDPSAPPGTTTSTTTTSSTSTTTTLPEPIQETRETGDLNGFGSEDLPRVRFIADSPQFGRPQVGDQVLTSGGSLSLAPPGIAVGTVANVIENPGTAGLELEVDLNVDLGRLSFLSVILYQPPTPVR